MTLLLLFNFSSLQGNSSTYEIFILILVKFIKAFVFKSALGIKLLLLLQSITIATIHATTIH